MNLRGMKKIENIWNIFARHGAKKYTSAIILAAGKSERMGEQALSKQLLPIDGIPVVVRSLLAFENSEYIHEIIVVAAKHEMSQYQVFKEKYSLTKLKAVTSGGSSRAESAYRGFLKVSKSCEFIAIHDAARCLIATEDIDRTVQEAYLTGAAIAAKKATDTIKKADSNGFVVETIDRSLIWLAQTPQVFKKSIYEVSAACAGKADEKITDDSMLAELSGFHVKLVECNEENLKITTRQDLALAEKIIQKRKRNDEI